MPRQSRRTARHANTPPEADTPSRGSRPGRNRQAARGESGEDASCQNGEIAGQDAPAAEPGIHRYSSKDVQAAEWFYEPWIGRHIYTLIVGPPSAGKSTFLASLCARASRSVVMPGEEDIRRAVLPRLLTAGVDLSSVSFIPTGDRWTFPHARDRLIRHIEAEHAQLVTIDPIDSYLESAVDENANLAVRRALDVLSLASEVTGCAIVIVRHPGKQASNLLAGSRAWRSHPRAILQMAALADDDSTGIIQAYKPPFGRSVGPHYYWLEGDSGKPRRWTMAKEAPLGRAAESAEVVDRQDRRRIDEAETFLRHLLDQGEEMDGKAVYRAAEGLQFKERTLRYAADRIGVKKRYEGFGADLRSYWKLPPKG